MTTWCWCFKHSFDSMYFLCTESLCNIYNMSKASLSCHQLGLCPEWQTYSVSSNQYTCHITCGTMMVKTCCYDNQPVGRSSWNTCCQGYRDHTVQVHCCFGDLRTSGTRKRHHSSRNSGCWTVLCRGQHSMVCQLWPLIIIFNQPNTSKFNDTSNKHCIVVTVVLTVCFCD